MLACATPRHHGRPEDRLDCRVMQAINRLFTRVYHRMRVLAPCPLPARGPAILICNHTSGLDPHLIQSCCRRLITWMMAREYYELPVIHPLLDRLGVIPVARSGRDVTAMRAALRALNNGQILGVFPEGRIETSDELMEFHVGAALLAIRSGAPVYCAFLDGTQRRQEMIPAFSLAQQATIAFAREPVQIERTSTDRAALERATQLIRMSVETIGLPTLRARLRQ